MREDDEGRARPEQRGDVLGRRAVHGIGVEPAQLEPACGRETLEHVPVGRELVPGDHDLGASGVEVERGGGELEEAHARRVGHDHLSCGGPDELADEIPDVHGQLEPALPPTANQPATPLRSHHVTEPLERRLGQPAQRVSVQVDEPIVGDHEPVAKQRERIRSIERRGAVSGEREAGHDRP